MAEPQLRAEASNHLCLQSVVFHTHTTVEMWEKEEKATFRLLLQSETRMKHLRTEMFRLYIIYITFQSTLIAALFNAAYNQLCKADSCHNWWIPCFLSAIVSVTIIVAVAKNFIQQSKTEKALERYEEEFKGVRANIKRLKREGMALDLKSQSPPPACAQDASPERRDETSFKWKDLWSACSIVVGFALVVFSCIVPLSCKLVLCSTR
eukprot:Gb_29025 [translate_table: standard]